MLTTKARFNYEWTLGGSFFNSDSLVFSGGNVFKIDTLISLINVDIGINVEWAQK